MTTDLTPDSASYAALMIALSVGVFAFFALAVEIKHRIRRRARKSPRVVRGYND